jgi:LEA14-like dessication related protein
MLEQRLRVSLRFQNANDFDITARGLDFELEVNGIALAQGVSNKTVSIPSLGEAPTTVDTSTMLFSLLREALVMVNRQEADYAIDATLHIDEPSRSKLRLRKKGLIDIAELMPQTGQPFNAPPLLEESATNGS